MSIKYRDDKKGKYQSVSASVEGDQSFEHGHAEFYAIGYGRTRDDAKKNLIDCLKQSDEGLKAFLAEHDNG